MYHTLDKALDLAAALGDNSVTKEYTKAMKGIKKAINTQLWDPSQGLYYDNTTIQIPESIHPQDGNSWAIIAGIASPKRAAIISKSLAKRWIRPYGAPAPEAGPTISPFASGFELEAHYLADSPELAEELIEFMWGGFMLDDPRMTNSSFIEGYSTNGSLVYAPYSNPARISYAHGWATTPTSALTFYAGGLQVTGAAGKTWRVQPRISLLRMVQAGFETPLGSFSVSWQVQDDGSLNGHFSVPEGTSGMVSVPTSSGRVVLQGENGAIKTSLVTANSVTFENVPGGTYSVRSEH